MDLGSDSSNESDLDDIVVDKNFKRSYEKRRRGEELSRMERLKDEGYGSDSDSDGSSEDEGGDMLTNKLDEEILETIGRIRKKDPSIYDASKVFCRGQEEESLPVKKAKKAKSMQYKDVVRERILEKMSNGDDYDGESASSEEEEGKRGGDDYYERKGKFDYDEEQEKIRRDFMNATNDGGEGGDDDDDEGFELKVNSSGDGKAEEDIKSKESAARMAITFDNAYGAAEGSADDNNVKDPKGEVSDGMKFLREYNSKRKWEEEDEADFAVDDRGEDNPDSSDEDDVDAADEFESEYNFRFEVGNDNGRVVSYSRDDANTVRKKDEGRKRKREKRKERKIVERKKIEDELRMLKNLKKEEIKSQLAEIRSVAGSSFINESSMQKILEGDYDPDLFERQMNEEFGNDYYEGEEEGDWNGNEPEDEGPYEEGDGGEDRDEDEGDDGDYGDYGDDGDDGDAGDEIVGQRSENAAKYRESSMAEASTRVASLSKNVKELYDLNYEDIISSMPTRFKYKSVATNSYGLTAEDILRANDRELNQYVGLKSIAAYRTEEFRVGKGRRAKFREGVREREEMERKESEREREDIGGGKDGDKGRDCASEKAAIEGEGGKKKSRRKKKGAKKNKVVGGEEEEGEKKEEKEGEKTGEKEGEKEGEKKEDEVGEEEEEEKEEGEDGNYWRGSDG